MRKLLFLSLFLTAPATWAAPPDPEVVSLAAWMTGTFDTFAQVARDETEHITYQHVRAIMKLAPISVPELGAGRALYLEQALAGSEDKPYRQRVYFVTRQEGVLINRIYRLTGQERFLGGTADPLRLTALTVDQLVPETGCDVAWARVREDLYAGTTGDQRTCKTSVRGATWVRSHIELTPSSITSLDQGFDDSGAQKWGPPDGTPGHTFLRRTVP